MPLHPEKVAKINKALRDLPPPFLLFHIDPETDSKSYDFLLSELLKYLESSLFYVTRYIKETGGDDPVGTVEELEMVTACFSLYRVLRENRP